MDGFSQDAAQTPDLLVLFYFLYSLVLAPFLDGEERQVPESGNGQTLGRKIPRMRKGPGTLVLLKDAKLEPQGETYPRPAPPPALQAPPRYVLGRSTAAGPPPAAPRPLGSGRAPVPAPTPGCCLRV